MRALKAFALADGGVSDLKAWDVAFYSERQRQAEFELSEEALREYFPAGQVIEGMFDIVSKVFGVDVKPCPAMATWHPDVLTYQVEQEGETVAFFYLDLYARAKKRGGAWMAECRNRRLTPDDHLQRPVAFLTCNFTPAVGDKPALLSHDEVVTLFHEFGHGLHHMLTKVTCAGVSGINGVEWDAVELPSQFLENWCWEREAIPMISAHIDSQEPLPDVMLNRLLAAKNFQAGMQMVRQLEFSLFDFRLHHEAHNDLGIQGVLDDVRNQVAVVEAPPFNRFQHSFGHIFSSFIGYAAGYYSYKWAEVLSADAFSAFESTNPFDRQVGDRFVSSILERGGSEDAMSLFVGFMGREPQVDALLRQEGIAR
jgi:oligopeptidase A